MTDKLDFDLIQRISRRSYRSRNLWPYRESHFALEYMGRAEFEFGAVPEAQRALLARADKLATKTIDISGQSVDLAYLSGDDDPETAFRAWIAADGESLKRPVYFLNRVLGRISPPNKNAKIRKRDDELLREYEAHVCWSLNDYLLFAFTEFGHLPELLDEIRAVSKEPAED